MSGLEKEPLGVVVALAERFGGGESVVERLAVQIGVEGMAKVTTCPDLNVPNWMRGGDEGPVLLVDNVVGNMDSWKEEEEDSLNAAAGDPSAFALDNVAIGAVVYAYDDIDRHIEADSGSMGRGAASMVRSAPVVRLNTG